MITIGATTLRSLTRLENLLHARKATATQRIAAKMFWAMRDYALRAKLEGSKPIEEWTEEEMVAAVTPNTTSPNAGINFNA